MKDIVTLTTSELIMAGYVGLIRRATSVERKLRDMDHPVKFPWEVDVVGAQSELAVSKYTNLYWSGMRSDHPADVGDVIEVRHVRERDLRLTVRPRDNSNSPFVLVYAKDNQFEMMGWLFGHQVKIATNETRPNGGSMCWMANNPLADMSLLFKWIAENTANSLVA